MEGLMPVVTYDEATHEYRVDGTPILSVTQALKAAGQGVDYSSVPPAALAYARDRGVYVDAACDLDDNEELDFDALHPEAVPYVRAWRAFKDEHRFVPLLQQPIVWHPDLRYCGRPDVIGCTGDCMAVVDRKCTEMELHDRALKSGPRKGEVKYGSGSGYALQLAAYTMPGICYANGTLDRLEHTDTGTSYARLVVQLKRDGTFSVYDCDEEARRAARDDYAAWQAVLQLARWRNGR